jgi:DNA-binding PadR family transcriptional regulator
MSSEIVILAMLYQRPRHGYELKKDVELAFGGTISLNNKTLYPALKQFEEMGAVTRQVIPQEGKPNRHLYQLTERGVELLHASLRDFGPEQAGNDAEFFTRVAFFGFLEEEERKAILTTRLVYLEACLKDLQNLYQMANSGVDCANLAPSMAFAQRVLTFHARRLHDEYAWVAAWLEEMQAPPSSS